MEIVFDKLKEFYKKKIAVYGIGIETEKNISKISDFFEIIGLLDSYKESGMIYGYPIISLLDAISKGVELIIVIARPGSCKAIAKRIGDICRKNNIALINLYGDNLLDVKKILYNFELIKSYTYDELLHELLKYSVVSFDLFDTLIIRRILFFEDLIDILDMNFRNHGIFIEHFKEKRIYFEKSLSNIYPPSLIEIYEKIISDKYINLNAFELAQMEFEIDKSLLTSRKDMLKLLHELKKYGKKVFITTDTYYSESQIRDILSDNMIVDFDDIIISNMHKTDKSRELFNILKLSSGSDNIIHIGDDLYSDIANAQKNNISSFHIYSGLDLFDYLGGLGLNEYIYNLSDRIKVGMFISEMFNSPFQFENNRKSLNVSDLDKLGFLFFAPIIYDFVKWFKKVISERKYNNIWFGARDGYLIKKIFELMFDDLKCDYILTSRTAAIRAGIQDEDDIRYVLSMKYSGDNKTCLKKRFGIVIDDSEINNPLDDIMDYKDKIFEKSSKQKNNYKLYLKSFVTNNNDIAFFDFVAKGTTQYFLQKIVENKITGLYFLQLEPENMKDKNIEVESFYNSYKAKDSVIFEDYYILETIMSSPQPSVDEFDNEGNPVFSEESRSKEYIDNMLSIQDGIINYISLIQSIFPVTLNEINRNLDEQFLRLIHNVDVLNTKFNEFIIEDPFFNRFTNVTDII